VAEIAIERGLAMVAAVTTARTETEHAKLHAHKNLLEKQWFERRSNRYS
jgi:hypothetical protein